MEDISRILQNRAQVTLQEVRGEENKVRAVSYTHLDVYKRQVQCAPLDIIVKKCYHNKQNI